MMRSFLTLAVLLGLLGLVLANTAVPDNWTPLAPGVCTKAPIAGLETTGPPYTGDNADWQIAEGVQSGSIGVTCSMWSNGNGRGVLANVPLWQQHYLLALSQDLYAGHHLPQNNKDWVKACAVNVSTQANAETGQGMCRSSCGVCYLVSGPEGAAVFVGNEIADYGAVGQNAIGLNLHLNSAHNGEVRSWGGVSKDIAFKEVYCPVDNKGMQVFVAGNYGNNAMFLTILNHRNRLVTVHVRAAEGTGNQTWLPLVADWVNRWVWATYSSADNPPWQKGWGEITRGSSSNQYELRLVDVWDNEVICRNLTIQPTNSIIACQDLAGKAVQFPVPDLPLTSCNGDSVKNLNLYGSDATTATASTASTASTATTSRTTTTTRSRTSGSSSSSSSMLLNFPLFFLLTCFSLFFFY